jgi:hypothetical protein
MIIRITPIAIAVAAIGGLVVAYSLHSPSTPEIRHAIPVKHEVRKATAVDSETDFDEVNLPPDTEIRREKPVQLRVAGRRQAQQRLSNAEQVGILPNHRQPDTPKREATEPEVMQAIAVSQPKDQSSKLDPVDQYQANVESDDDDEDDE